MQGTARMDRTENGNEVQRVKKTRKRKENTRLEADSRKERKKGAIMTRNIHLRTRAPDCEPRRMRESVSLSEGHGGPTVKSLYIPHPSVRERGRTGYESR